MWIAIFSAAFVLFLGVMPDEFRQEYQIPLLAVYAVMVGAAVILSLPRPSSNG